MVDGIWLLNYLYLCILGTSLQNFVPTEFSFRKLLQSNYLLDNSSYSLKIGGVIYEIS